MVVYFEGGTLGGRAKNVKSKKINSIQNNIKKSEEGWNQVEWYRKTGKHVGVVQGSGKNKRTIRARVFRLSNVTIKDDYGVNIKEKHLIKTA
jgi:hypothetical protein